MKHWKEIIMKKRACLVCVASLVAMLLFMYNILPTFAASMQPTLAGRTKPRGHVTSGKWQENNQYFHFHTNNSENHYESGHNQANSGNQKYNGGYNQDSSGNEANQILNRNGITGYQKNNQYFRVHSNNSANLHYSGSYQSDSGNSGHNDGYNLDNSGNLGNQIVN
jgi:hypothetical protein